MERVRRPQQFAEHSGAHRAVGVQHPQSFQRGLAERGLVPLPRGQPRIECRDDDVAAESAQPDARVISDDVLRMGEQRKELRHGRAFDVRPVFDHRPPRVDDAPDAALLVVPLRVAHRMLRVADDAAGEVRDVERAIEAELAVHGPERGVGGADQIQAVRADDGPGVGIGLRDGDEVAAEQRGGRDALLILGRKVRTRNDTERGAFAVVQHRRVAVGMIRPKRRPGERQALKHMPATVALEEVAVAVEGNFPRIGRHALPLGGDAARAGLQPIRGGIHPAHHAERRLELRPVKDAVAENHMPQRIARDHAAVMRVRHVHATQQLGLGIRPAIAIAVREQQQPGLRRDDDATLVESDAVQRIEAVREHRALVRFPVAIGVFENQNLIPGRRAGNGVRKRWHRHDPQPAARVERHLHRAFQIGELHLRREEVERVAVGDFQILLLLRRGFHHAASEAVGVALALRHRRQGRNGKVGEVRGRLAHEVVQHLLGLLNESVIAWHFRGVFLGPLPHAVIHHAVLRAHEVGDMARLLRGGLGHILDPPGGHPRHRRLTQQRARDGAADFASARLGEVNALRHERHRTLRVCCLAGRKEVHEQRAASLRQIRNHRRVSGDFGIAWPVIGNRDGREQHELRIRMQPSNFP